MRDRLQKLFAALALDRRIKLSWLLVGINVALVLLVVIGISFSAVRLLRNLADSQGTVRVQLAGATAREELRKLNEDILTNARDLARRSTLRRLIDEESPAAIEPFLRRACQQLNADICAVIQANKVIAQSSVQAGATASWKEILAATSEQGERFMAVPATLAKPVFGATASVADASGKSDVRVYVLKALDEPLAAKLSERAGLAVRLVSYRAFANMPPDAFTRLHSSAVSDGRSAAARIDELALFASSFPVFAVTGEAIALIETRLPAAELDASVGALVRRLLITALVLGAPVEAVVPSAER